MSQDSFAKFKALQLPFLCFHKLFKTRASGVLRSPGSVPYPRSHLDFIFLCPKYPWPTLFVFYSLHFLLWCPGTTLCLVLRGHRTGTAPASSGFTSDPLHSSAVNCVVQNSPPHLRTSCCSAILHTFQGVPTGSFEVLLFLYFSDALLLPSASFRKNSGTMQVFKLPVFPPT